MSEQIMLSSADGHRLRAHINVPHGRPLGGLVVMHEFLGITDYVQSVCADYAANGYAAIAPSLYDRQEAGVIFGGGPEDFARAAEFRKQLVWDEVMLDVDAARMQVSPHGKCGIIGFCLGGSVAWLAASRPGFAAAISYYGKDVPDWLDKKPLCPVMLHFGDSDPLIPLDGVEKTRAAYPDMPVHVYAAGHAFDNPRHGADRAAALLARARSVEFLRAHVG